MPQSALTAGKVQECESRSRFPLKRYTFQRVYFGKKRGYRCCRSPYSSVIANGDSPLGCLRPLCRNPRRVALDACTPLGLQARPYGPPIGPVFATCLTVCGVRGCRHEMDFRALSRRKPVMEGVYSSGARFSRCGEGSYDSHRNHCRYPYRCCPYLYAALRLQLRQHSRAVTG